MNGTIELHESKFKNNKEAHAYLLAKGRKIGNTLYLPEGVKTSVEVDIMNSSIKTTKLDNVIINQKDVDLYKKQTELEYNKNVELETI